MADNTEKMKKGLLKDILKEMKGANQRFEQVAQAEMDAAAEGKGAISGTFARMGARQKVAKEYVLATKGALNKRAAFFEGMGLENVGKMLDTFFPGEKKEPPAELIKKFGLDKKSAKQGGASNKNIAKPLSLILRNVLETKKMIKTIESSLSKASTPKGGRYVFDSRMAGGGRYRDTVTNKLVSTKKAQSERTDALTAAINADEQPLVKLKESLDIRFKELHDKLDKILNQIDLIDQSGSEGGIFENLFDRRNKRRTRTPNRNKKPTMRNRLKNVGRGATRLATRAIGATAPVVGVATAAATVGLVVGGAAYMASGKAADVAKEPMKELERKYGLKVLYNTKGNTVGYSVNGKNYGLNDLPQEYKDLIAAYGPGDKRNFDAREALARIKKNPEKYKMLELGYTPKTTPATAPPAKAAAPTSPVTAAAPSALPGSSTVGAAISTATSAPVAAGSRASIDTSSADAGITQSLAATDKSVSSDIKNMTGSPINVAMQEAGLTNKFAQIALLANIKKESNFKPISENMNYKNTAIDRIRKIFGRRAAKYNDAELTQIKSNPATMGELMYGKDTSIGQSMGNTEVGDGYKYRGRGYIQLTGKNNYKFYGKKVGENLVGNPDLANDPTVAAKISASYVMTALKGKQEFADQKTANYAITKAIGGNLDLTKGYGAEILAKVNAYSGESGLVASASGGGGGTMGGGGSVSGGSSVASSGGVSGGSSVASSGGVNAAASAPASLTPASSDPLATMSDGTAVDSRPMVAQAPSTVPLTPVQNTTGTRVAQGSSQLASSQMTAAVSPPPAAPVVVNNNAGGGSNKMPPQAPKQPLPMASTRSSENSFIRAISKDFAHPTSFTSSVIV